VLDRGLAAVIDPARQRMRASVSSGRFVDGARQREDVVVATHIPKNTTRSSSVERRVRSPHGGPAVHDALRRWGSDGKRHERIVERNFHDPERGQTSLACPAQLASCKAWNEARSASGILEELSPELIVNGRFNGITVADRGALLASGGNLAYDTAIATDDGGAFSAKWSSAKRMLVSTFPTAASASPTVNPLDPVVQVVKDAAGRAVVAIRGTLPGGAPTVVSSVLD